MSTRSAGVLLHVTSLPGRFGIGDLGPSAYRWVDVLADAGQSRWQILPLGPTDPGGGPYGSYSAFAGNPWLISPEQLHRDGLVTRSELSRAELSGPIRFDAVAKVKDELLASAWKKYRSGDTGEFDRFVHRKAGWLDDFALFTALSKQHGSFDWTTWDGAIARRQRSGLRQACETLQDVIQLEQFKQFLFDRQWRAVRDYANGRGIKIIGDVPIFVSRNSVDVWKNPGHFLLDRHFQPKAVAGVPPDYFSADGQRWGNPLYNWPVMQRDGFHWWIDRIRTLTEQADVVRIDHFRGLAACWHIPADRPTARIGKWVKTPGEQLLSAVRKRLGGLPLIAEDLGLVTPDVVALRDEFELPGMRVAQFGFDTDSADPFLPHNFVRNTVAYTGTHDNDTTAGWWKSLDKKARRRVEQYVPGVAADPAGALSRAVLASVADTAVIPAQDVLALPTRDRMNLPGEGDGNWRWRLKGGYDKSPRWETLAGMSSAYGRTPAVKA